MGSPESEAGRDDDEGPVHRVTIGRPFAVGVKEVTRGEFGRFVSETGHSTGNACTEWYGEWKTHSGWSWKDPGFSQTDDHPVVCVTWHDARAYVKWLSGKTGKGYRLLSGSEWSTWREGGRGHRGIGGRARRASASMRTVRTRARILSGGQSVMTVMRRQHRWVSSWRTGSGCTMYWGTYGSGWRTAERELCGSAE